MGDNWPMALIAIAPTVIFLSFIFWDEITDGIAKVLRAWRGE